MRSIVVAALLSACSHNGLERAPQSPVEAPIIDEPSGVVTRYCTELDRDQSGPYALYVLCSSDAPETSASHVTRE